MIDGLVAYRQGRPLEALSLVGPYLQITGERLEMLRACEQRFRRETALLTQSRVNVRRRHVARETSSSRLSHPRKRVTNEWGLRRSVLGSGARRESQRVRFSGRTYSDVRRRRKKFVAQTVFRSGGFAAFRSAASRSAAFCSAAFRSATA